MTIDRSTPNSVYWSSQKDRNRKLLESYKYHKMAPTIHNGRLLEPYVYSIFDHKYLGYKYDSIDRFQIWLDENKEIYKHLIEIGDLDKT